MREAVRVTLSNGLSLTCMAADLGIGKWVLDYRQDEPVLGPQADLAARMNVFAGRTAF